MSSPVVKLTLRPSTPAPPSPASCETSAPPPFVPVAPSKVYPAPVTSTEEPELTTQGPERVTLTSVGTLLGLMTLPGSTQPFGLDTAQPWKYEKLWAAAGVTACARNSAATI